MALLREIERFLRETNMPMTRFGRLAVHDPRFVQDLRNGREPGPETVKKVRLFMEGMKTS
jgi:2,4-dienoyl-CoA reductase-like NADH-dependent reductase (Old Yellow Enzyme family)